MKYEAIAYIFIGYYNARLADWEPMVEHHGFQVKFERKPTLNPKADIPYIDKIFVSDVR